ncbi:MAG: hypothetical protein HXY49_06045 [Ignavibacteriaceae bacterium]|jgi:hypothetical protein|nr:hypothetical protein [Ignavibacteriaceae bacterium]
MKTNFYIPDNIFSKIFLSELSEDEKINPVFLSSSTISKRLFEEEHSIGLMPTMDLIHRKDFFVSSDVGISFNALLSNAYLHFRKEERTLDQVFYSGDITSNEIILSKILFRELYEVEIKQTVLKDNLPANDENVIIVGDDNYKSNLFLQGLSFAEEIIELIEGPYVNFVLASKSESLIKDFTKKHLKDFNNGHPESVEELFKEFPQISSEFIAINLQHVVFNLESQDIEGIKLLLQMPYFHEMINEMLDLKLV